MKDINLTFLPGNLRKNKLIFEIRKIKAILTLFLKELKKKKDMRHLKIISQRITKMFLSASSKKSNTKNFQLKSQKK